MAQKYTNIETNILKIVIFIFCLFSLNPVISQNQTDPKSSYTDYVNLPREVAFAHLNKSLYIKGETIGFSVYVFDKNTKKPSPKTTNVYTVITDDKNNTIKEQLIWAKDGKANGIFYVDSTFTSGNYTFKAFTNWMKNFDEQNFYSQSIKVIDPSANISEAPMTITSKLDAQFLPEGGHLVADTENTVGVVIKDTLGYGVPNLTGNILDQNDMVVSNFKTNAMGIGKFLLLHESKKSYRVELDFRNRIQTFDLKTGDTKGINMMLNLVASKVALTFNTNTKTLPLIKDKIHTLFIHNGFESKSIAIVFDKSTRITKAIAVNDLFTGINVFTVFNDNNQPVLERLYFNHIGIKTAKTGLAITQKTQDSLRIQIPFKGFKPIEMAHLSVSVLPSDTKSYNADHNILSYTYLQPYVKGYIENAKYYFTNINKKKMYELDNLLLTQGWSSYNWNDVFKNPPTQQFEFETGLSFNANTRKNDAAKYILLTSSNHEAQAYVVNDNENTFNHTGFFIEDDQAIQFTEVISDTKMKKPNLYLQFSPSKIPQIDNFLEVLTLRENSIFEANKSDITFNKSWEDIEQLDEVIIQANLEKKRRDKLFKRFPTGNVDFFDDDKRRHSINLSTYLAGKGYQTSESTGSLSISVRRGGRNYTPAVFLNGFRVISLASLFQFDMSDIDYITLDRTTRNYDASRIGLGGSIHIKTDLSIRFKNDTRWDYNQTVKPPLSFTTAKTYYAPEYVYYDTDFFREYGVIDWVPNVIIDASKSMTLKLLDTKTKQIKLYIEGVTNEGRFISEEKTIDINLK